jgi:preprotein translocase subunit SecG
MYVFISILILISSVLLVLIVLIQNSKGGGLAAGFSSSNQVLGVRKTTDFLEKATWMLAGLLVVFCIGITAFIPRNRAVSTDSDVIENISTPINTTAAPDFGTAQPEAVPSGTLVPPVQMQDTPEE